MKKVNMKIAMAAFLIMAGSLGLGAQTGPGNGNCQYRNQLNEEQLATLDELRTSFQTEMGTLRNNLRSTANPIEKTGILREMKTLRDAHLAEVKSLLASWGIITNPAGAGKSIGNSQAGGFRNGAGAGECNGTGIGMPNGNRK